MRINLLVIRTKSIEVLKTQYEQLGLEFQYHQHGSGPFHYSADFNEFVLEIYPFTKHQTQADSALRLGFQVNNLDSLIADLSKTNWKVLSQPALHEWGRTAVIQDLDGRKIELTQKQ